eukprot:TRINITY_DN5456_c0_g1_i15.p1 TRINITY_DN5456_c0_g1~~TRINITY_DN5456_c0_g1_i15.p1  ORF type:complete len:314 (+),score=90.52 TRINITY_DN5456_c0_g1_i15:113-943(+)
MEDLDKDVDYLDDQVGDGDGDGYGYGDGNGYGDSDGTHGDGDGGHGDGDGDGGGDDDDVIGKDLELFSDIMFDDDLLSLYFVLTLPVSSKKMLLLSLLEDFTNKFVLHHVPGIQKSAILRPDTNHPQYRLHTAGINFQEVYSLNSVIDIHNIYVNDPARIFAKYGIEAARAVAINEMANVFKAYSIDVNFRHLSLIADYMTFQGTFTAFNRTGIKSNPSPFLKMSYETTLSFITDAVLFGEYDTVTSPSAQLVYGILPSVGTGVCEIRQNLTPLKV